MYTEEVAEIIYTLIKHNIKDCLNNMQNLSWWFVLCDWWQEAKITQEAMGKTILYRCGTFEYALES